MIHVRGGGGGYRSVFTQHVMSHINHLYHARTTFICSLYCVYCSQYNNILTHWHLPPPSMGRLPSAILENGTFDRLAIQLSVVGPSD